MVVVRWYGGVKLGTGGLARAYRETAAETLRLRGGRGSLRLRTHSHRGAVRRIGDVYRLVAPPDIVLVATEFGEENEFSFDVRLSRADEFRRKALHSCVTSSARCGRPAARLPRSTSTTSTGFKRISADVAHHRPSPPAAVAVRRHQAQAEHLLAQGAAFVAVAESMAEHEDARVATNQTIWMALIAPPTQARL